MTPAATFELYFIRRDCLLFRRCAADAISASGSPTQSAMRRCARRVPVRRAPMRLPYHTPSRDSHATSFERDAAAATDECKEAEPTPPATLIPNDVAVFID